MGTDATGRDFGKRFKDKVVVITGSTAGIGLATAVRLGQEGAQGMFTHYPAKGAVNHASPPTVNRHEIVVSVTMSS